jgi:hypothetical protein
MVLTPWKFATAKSGYGKLQRIFPKHNRVFKLNFNAEADKRSFVRSMTGKKIRGPGGPGKFHYAQTLLDV